MPAYFGDVVNQKQRDEIYKIQAAYEEQLASLRMQLKAVVAKRDAEIHGVLTPEQHTQIQRMAAEAKAEREAALKAKLEGDEADPAEAAPAP